MTTDSLPTLMIECKESDISEYNTKDIPVGKPYMYLRNCCKYAAKSPVPNMHNLFQKFTSQTQWLYYASFSPLWNMRLQKYNAMIQHDKHDVVFKTDDEMDNFMDKFGFEPDEQPLQIQKSCVGIL